MSDQREIILRKAIQELDNGMVVNLGIGMPTHLPPLLPDGLDVTFHSENGFIGMGRPRPGGTRDDDVIDAGGQSCTLIPGAACFDSVLSFAVIRRGRLDAAVLGAFQVSLEGDLANWMIPGKLTPGMGGGMELAQKARRVIVVSQHVDKRGRGKLVERCTLPLTAAGCVDTLITEQALFRRREGRLVLTSVHPSRSVEAVLEPLEIEPAVADRLEEWE